MGKSNIGYAWVCPCIIYMGKPMHIMRRFAHVYNTWADVRILHMGMSHAYYTWANPRVIYVGLLTYNMHGHINV